MNVFRIWSSALLLAALSMIAVAMYASAQDVPETIRVNVIACVDPDCADTVNLVTMEGATVSSHDTDGTLLDSCTSTVTPSGMTDCSVIPAPDGGWYTTEPTAEYSGYVLVSSDPEVFVSEMHGTILVWYYAPEADNVAPPPTQVPAPVDNISELPSTGTGPADDTGLLAIAAISMAMLAMVGTRLRHLHHS